MIPSLRRHNLALSVVASIAYYSRFSEACSVMEANRYGNYILEDSVRTTWDPSLLVAQVGEYNQTEADYWNTYDPVFVQNVTIDVTSGRVYLGHPEGLPIHEPLPSTVPTKNYTVQTPNDIDDTSAAVLTGPELPEPFVFDYTKPDSSRLEDVFVYSDALERGYFFHNSPMATNEGGPPMPPGYDTEPVVAIFDLADPENVTTTRFFYEGRPNYFNGPPHNHWDSIRVVELRENGADCFLSAFFGYNETAVWLVGTKGFTRDAFNLNAVAVGDDDAFAYNAINVALPLPHDERSETPVEYKLSKQNIATGETMEIVLNGTNVNDPLPLFLLDYTPYDILVEGGSNYTFANDSTLPTAVERSGAEEKAANGQDDVDYTEGDVEEAAYSGGASWSGSRSSVWIASIVLLAWRM